MAYEHGSLDLGIRNPFKLEGALRTTRGIIVTLLGLVLLLQVADAVKHDPVTGWAYAAIGFILLVMGLWTCGSGMMQVLRFFVGRSVPTSLAYNHAKSESDSAAREQHDVAYDADQIEQMMVGRKNLTFAEPLGLVARLLHTLFPRLTFVPYPIRNLAQRLAGALTQTLLALACYALAWFTTSTGLAGQTGPLMLPVFTTLLLLYLVVVWYRAGRPISRNVARTMESEGSGKLARTLALAILAPVGISWLLQQVLNNNSSFARTVAQLQGPVEEMGRKALEGYSVWQSYSTEYSNGLWLGVLVVLALISCGLLVALTYLRSGEAKPITEVAELRDNWQESVHPREIFINIDSMVMANRRHKEVPNRVYRALQPHLQEQADGKGSFFGEMIQETQPVAMAKPLTGPAKALRIASTALGQLLLLAAALVLYMVIEPVTALIDVVGEASQTGANLDHAVLMASYLGSAVNLLMGLMLFAAFGRLLANFAHVFWGEIQFESLLVYFKCEGTFTESRVSTGTGVYDSTQSENTVVRSSMTPWVIVTRLVTSTFAGIGSRNLEYARHILEMRSDDAELQGIVGDLRQFLKNRETIASISNEKDLEAASKIYQVNEQTRAAPQAAPTDAPQLSQSHQSQLEYQTD
ncbi:hypothetical protein [Ferrimonas balearica]|uniref:hypothetical protein n=1 Tax=Ferrimonas balearica TaxID=44012 RepID=UPI001C999A7A|nr:hypothetical protein [Ferrimonas balearica]MBY5921790.1 hypothetical protein [Ferrimonas balearica]MBY5994870.1 hypothetical protein [Ferrimonas balearica]